MILNSELYVFLLNPGAEGYTEQHSPPSLSLDVFEPILNAGRELQDIIIIITLVHEICALNSRFHQFHLMDIKLRPHRMPDQQLSGSRMWWWKSSMSFGRWMRDAARSAPGAETMLICWYGRCSRDIQRLVLQFSIFKERKLKPSMAGLWAKTCCTSSIFGHRMSFEHLDMYLQPDPSGAQERLEEDLGWMLMQCLERENEKQRVGGQWPARQSPAVLRGQLLLKSSDKCW